MNVLIFQGRLNESESDKLIFCVPQKWGKPFCFGSGLGHDKGQPSTQLFWCFHFVGSPGDRSDVVSAIRPCALRWRIRLPWVQPMEPTLSSSRAENDFCAGTMVQFVLSLSGKRLEVTNATGNMQQVPLLTILSFFYFQVLCQQRLLR